MDDKVATAVASAIAEEQQRAAESSKRMKRELQRKDEALKAHEGRVQTLRDEARSVVTLVPIRPRWRGERRSLRTFSPGVRLSPPTPRFQSRHTSAPFNSASDAFQLHPDVRSYGQLPSARETSRRDGCGGEGHRARVGDRRVRRATRQGDAVRRSKALESSFAAERRCRTHRRRGVEGVGRAGTQKRPWAGGARHRAARGHGTGRGEDVTRRRRPSKRERERGRGRVAAVARRRTRRAPGELRVVDSRDGRARVGGGTFAVVSGRVVETRERRRRRR